MARPKYAIINDTDAPHPNMVVQWVPNVGYCYMNRTLSRHDGMQGSEATDIRAFGFSWAEDPDGVTRFYRNTLDPTATYSDGEPRLWQPRSDFFEWRMIKSISKSSRATKTKPVTG